MMQQLAFEQLQPAITIGKYVLLYEHEIQPHHAVLPDYLVSAGWVLVQDGDRYGVINLVRGIGRTFHWYDRPELPIALLEKMFRAPGVDVANETRSGT